MLDDEAVDDYASSDGMLSDREIAEEKRRLFRQAWFIEHRTHLFIGIGIVLIALTFLFIRLYQKSTNPVNRFMSASAKTFESSFSFDLTVGEDGEDIMHYTGALTLERAHHGMSALYDAQYTDYGYTAATLATGTSAVSGNYYDEKWRLHSCTDAVHNFYDFDTDFRGGRFDAGAFLRFTGLTSDYSATELERFFNSLRDYMASDSTIASVTRDSVDGGTEYTFDISLEGLFRLIESDGASVFYRSSDYDAFKQKLAANESLIHAAVCKLNFLVDNKGCLSAITLTLGIGEKNYSFNCIFSEIGSADVELPEGFTEAVAAFEEETASEAP